MIDFIVVKRSSAANFAVTLILCCYAEIISRHELKYSPSPENLDSPCHKNLATPLTSTAVLRISLDINKPLQ